MNTKSNYNLPDGQRNALEYIKQHIEEHDQSPTYNEIAAALGIKPPSARDFVLALAERGFLTIIPGKQRSIYLL